MPKKYQNKSEVVVEIPQDYVVRFDATDSSGIGYLTDEATNDVDSWADQTGTVTLLDSGVVTNYPEYVRDADGLPCVHFQRDGTLVSTFFGTSSVDSTSFCVVKYNDMASESSNAYSLRSWGDFRVINTNAGGSKLSMFPVSIDDTTNDFDDTRCVLGFTNTHVGTDDNDWFKYLGLTQVSSGTAATDAATDDRRLEMGGYGGGSESDCNIYELIVYDRVLSNGECAAVAKYLSAKWGAQNEDSASSVIAEPLNTFPQDYWERWDATTSSGMRFVTDEATGDISTWLGEKGNTFLDSSHGGTIDPIWTPGKVTFDGSGDAGLRTPVVTSIFSGNPRAVFAAGQINTASPANGSIFAGPTAYIRIEDISDATQLAFNDGVNNENPSTNNLIDTSIACGYSTDTTDINWWWGANSKNTDTVSGGTFNETLANFYVGQANAAATTTMDGDVYEVIVYDRHVSDAEAERILNYLSAKWQCQNEDSASTVIAAYDGLGHTWKSDGPDPQGLQLESFTPVNHTVDVLSNKGAPNRADNSRNDKYPNTLPDLRFWYRSDYTADMTFDTGNAIEGGTVSAITDITGNSTCNVTSSGGVDPITFHPGGAVKGGFPSLEGGNDTTLKSLKNTVTVTCSGSTDNQRLLWSVGTMGDATKSGSYGGPNSNINFAGTYSAMSTDMVAKPLISYCGAPTTGITYGIADAGLPADDGRIHITVWRITDTGTDATVESWYAGLKLPDRVSTSASGTSTSHAIGALSTNNFDANGSQFLEMGLASPSTGVQKYTDGQVEGLIRYLCARYKVDYMPENTPITIGCWSRQTASNGLTDCCLWHDPSTMTPTSWALHPNVAQYHTTPANFAISPPTGAVPMEKRTGTLGKPTFRSTEGMTQFMESDNSYTSSETTDFPADTLGMSTFGVMRLDPATVAASGARTGNGICHVRFSGTSDTTLQVLASNVSKNWAKANDWIIIGNTYGYDDDGTGTEGYPGSVDGGPGAYYYCNDETVLTAATPAATSYTVENWLNWDISDGVAHMSELVTFKHPLDIHEINELRKYFLYKYNNNFEFPLVLPHYVDENTVAHWEFNGDALDSTGNKAAFDTGTYVGGTTTPYPYEFAVHDHTAAAGFSYSALDADLDTLGPFTFGAALYLDSLPTGGNWRPVVRSSPPSGGTGSGNNHRYTFRIMDDGTLQYQHQYGNKLLVSVATTMTVPVGEWFYLGLSRADDGLSVNIIMNDTIEVLSGFANAPENGGNCRFELFESWDGDDFLGDAFSVIFKSVYSTTGELLALKNYCFPSTGL